MAPGPLDRWVRRPPLEPVQQSASGDERDQQTAEPPAGSTEQQKAPAGSLRAFLVKLDKPEGVQADVGMQDAQVPPRRRPHRTRCTLDWQLTGRMSSSTAALLHHDHSATIRQLAILESHAWQRQVLGGTPLSPEEAGAIQCAAFDSQGELLVAGSEEGLITVHSTAQLLAAGAAGLQGSQPPPPQQQRVGTADPLLVLDSHLPKLQAVRWNPADENVVGVVSSATRQLHLYDLQHTQGQPKQVLSVPQQAASAIGLTDLAFFGGSSRGGGSSSGSGYVLLASGMGGQVFLWDTRAKAAPSATLAAAQCGAMYAVQLAPDGQVVLAGTQSGEVKLWDLRGGSSSTLRFGGTLHHHPLLAAVNMRHALTAVPGLARQTAIPASAVHSMQLDPCDTRRLAFHLGCGWSGVLRLHGGGGGAITHLHAPAHTYPDEAAAAGGSGTQEISASASAAASVAQMLLWASTAAPALHRHGCWVPGGRRYVVPSRRDDALMLLDFADSAAAGCYCLREEEERDGPEGFSSSSRSSSSGGSRHGSAEPRIPSAAHVALSQAAVCAAAHPMLDVLVAGGMSSCLSLAGPS